MRCRERQAGFTMVELVVVLLIVAVLIIIGLPTYQGFRNRALDRDTQADLRGAVLVENLYHLDNAMFTETTSLLAELEPLISFNVAGDPEGTVRVRTGAADVEVCAFSLSRSGLWWAVYHATSGGTRYGQSAPATCNAALASGWSADGW